MGYQLLLASSPSEKDITNPTWTLSLPKKEQVLRVIKSRQGPIATLGRVTDGRGTLYKYLNPHLNAVLASGKKGKCAVYVVDIVSGSIVYHATFTGGGVDCEDVEVALSDNTLIYTYWDNGEVKGQRVVSVEMYEGSQVDEKTKRLASIRYFHLMNHLLIAVGSSELSSFSSDMANVQIFEQSYLLPDGVTALSTTFTKFGMAVKDIIGQFLLLSLLI